MQKQTNVSESRPLTLAENLVLTATLLGGGGALVGAIWALDRLVG